MPVLQRPARTAHAWFAWALLPCLAVAGCSSPAGGPKTKFSTGPWQEGGIQGRRIETEHYVLYSTLDDRQLEAALPGFLEACYQEYEGDFPSRPAEPLMLTTYMFGQRQEWDRYIRRRHASRYATYSRIRSGGFTEGDTSVSFYTSRPAALAVAAHEGLHQYLGARFPYTIPAWLNEGLACYHESFSHAGDRPKFMPKRNLFRINNLRDALQRDELLQMAEIVKTDAGQIIRNNHSVVTHTYYAQAWALVVFLRHGPDSKLRAGFKEMMGDMADGSFPREVSAMGLQLGQGRAVTAGEAAFVRYFGQEPEALESAYYSFLIKLCGFQ